MENSEKNSSELPLDPNLSQPETQGELTQDNPKVGGAQKPVQAQKPNLSSALTSLSQSQGWAQGAKEAKAAARKMTHSQILLQGRLNSGYIVTAIHELPKPGSGASRKIKKPSTP